jgi:hypothetical protein
MSQNPTCACMQCGVQNPLSQPFCSNCGARQDVSAPNIPSAFPVNDISSGQSNPYGEQSSPYQSSPYQGASSTQYGGGYQQGYQQPQQQGYQQPYQQTPLYAQPQSQSNTGGATTGIIAVILGLFLLREVRNRIIGCAFTLIIVVAIIGCTLLSHH